MQGLPRFSDPNLLVGAEHFSDAGVYRLDDHTAIVQSVDFFPPLVDDPFIFGQIAAANALSDLYTAGAQPRTALNLVGFPDDRLPLKILHEILRGGAERVAAAGAVVVGGHSVRDRQITFGLSVTGVVDPARMMTNQGAKPGDVLVLTKALGTGFVTTAERARRCPPEVLERACASMIQLNAAASQAALDLGAVAATDVTGFGLAGHAAEMAAASNVTLMIDLPRLPLLEGALELARRGHLTRANRSNAAFAFASARFDAQRDDPRAQMIVDPQTSGGLLVAIAPDRVDELVRRCRDAGLEATAIIGEVMARGAEQLVIG